MYERIKLVMIVCFGTSLLSGCMFDQAHPDDPAYAPISPAQLMPPPNTTGAIYQAGYERRLFEDVRAARVGDMLTINLVETTTAGKSAKTSMTKVTAVDVSQPTLFGGSPTFDAPGSLPLVGKKSNTLNSKLDSNNAFSGEGKSDQSNNLTGNITVTVAEVLPNEYLVVRGEKWLSLNRGKEYIRFSGIVRPQDVSADNTVESTRVANARITYSGTGEVSESNGIGWLARFFSSAIWPF